MPIIRATHSASTGSSARLLAPRDDALVVECEQGPGRFEAVGGPFAQWTRTVDECDDGTLREVITYRSAVPHWGRLVDVLLRRVVRSGVDGGAAPWWSPPDRLNAHEANVLGLTATLALLAGFLGGLVTQTLTFVAKDLGGNTWTQSVSLSVIRIGALFTLGAMAMADRVGRRPLVRWCLSGAAIAATMTAVSPDIWTVTATQTVCRGLVAGAALLLPVICAEELPAGSRAFATGVLALSGGLGVGMVLWVLPVVDAAPWAWRLIYVLALPILAVVGRCMRALPETRRFEHDEAEVAAHPQHMRVNRFAVLAGAVFLLNVFAGPVGQLQNEYLRTARHFSGTEVAAFLLLTNTWGFIGIVAGSQLSDRRSRRLAARIGLVGYAVGNVAMFAVSGAAMWAASVFGSVVGAALVPSFGAMLPELFPTLRRGTANGMLNIAGVLGSVAGLLTTGALVDHIGYGRTFAILAITPLIVVGMVRWIPETAGIELEVLNPDEE